MLHPENPRDWYGLGRWKMRAQLQRRQHPLCKFCLDKNLVVSAVIADHVEPHRGDWNLFWLGRLQSLCKRCHESGKKYAEARGFRSDIGEDGWPIDRDHPTYRGMLGGKSAKGMFSAAPSAKGLPAGKVPKGLD